MKWSTENILFIPSSVSLLFHVLNQCPALCPALPYDSRKQRLQSVGISVLPRSPPVSSSHWGSRTTPRQLLSPSPTPSSPCSQTLNRTSQIKHNWPPPPNPPTFVDVNDVRMLNWGHDLYLPPDPDQVCLCLYLALFDGFDGHLIQYIQIIIMVFYI